MTLATSGWLWFKFIPSISLLETPEMMLPVLGNVSVKENG